MSPCCRIAGCNASASVLVTCNHPEPSARWSEHMCMEHAREFFADKYAGGLSEITLAPIKGKEPK